MINRKNILEFIGSNKSKYHSCILTCYSFDFSFFEERVLYALRSANIKNINVFADGHYLDTAQEMTTGREFKHNKTYNFHPVFERGVFHPKIMLLTGERHGLLIIGSGNITSSGLNTNDEIWGAFHLNDIANENAPLFGAVWKYLHPYLCQTLGFVKQKIKWILKNSPWLTELPTIENENWIDLESIGVHLKFIANTDQMSVYTHLTASVPNEEVENFTIISPYYDRSGKQLKQLKDHFDPKKMICIVEPNSGLLPTESTIEGIEFYNWAACNPDYDATYSRLHAKFIYIQLKREEYLLIGSANVTIAGMGTPNGNAKNAEAGVLLKRPKKRKSWLEELKIKIPDTSIDIQQYAQNGLRVESTPRENYKYRILYSELRNHTIFIHLNRDCKDELQAMVLDRTDGQLKNKAKVEGNIIKVETSDPENVFKVTLITDEQERISNYSLVHRLEALLRCNPDKTHEKLYGLFEQDFTDGDGITVLLEHVEYNWADDEDSAARKVHSSTIGVSKQEARKEEQPEEYEVLNAKEFNKESDDFLLDRSQELFNPNVKIVEFLNILVSGAYGKDDDFEESEEQKLLEDEEQKGEGEEVEYRSQRKSSGAKEKAALNKYFKRLNSIYERKLKLFFKTKVLAELPKEPTNISSLSAILIALHLIHIKYGRKFILKTNDVDERGNTIKIEETFIHSGRVEDSVESVKGFFVNVLGKFLLLLGSGSKEYKYDLVDQRMKSNQVQFLTKSTCLILNTLWYQSEKRHRDILLLNCLYFSIGEELLNEEAASDFLKKLDEFQDNANYVIPQYKEQLEYFKNELFPCYLEWLGRFVDKEGGREKLISSTSNLKRGNIIFKSNIGFNAVKKVSSDKLNFRLHLVRAGYPFVSGEFELKKIQFGAKVILYS